MQSEDIQPKSKQSVFIPYVCLVTCATYRADSQVRRIRTFSCTCKGVCARSEFLRRPFILAGCDPNLVEEVESSYPYHIELDNLMLKITNLYSFPTWEDDLHIFMESNGLLA